MGFVTFSCVLAHADPWGKDADLCRVVESTSSRPKRCQTPILGDLGETLIRFHQKVISPADGPRSHFVPCSSQYTLNAMRTYGFVRGFTMGCDRLMRENSEPWIYSKIFDSNGNAMKWDPVR
jgi:putative component of membrane protein insertase Oxa1/YidC/SpoIIIJ protein YidD